MAGLKGGLDVGALHRIQDGIGEDLMQLNVLCAEAERERAVRSRRHPTPALYCVRCTDCGTTL